MPSTEITVGEHRRQVRLNSEAVYRVCDLDGDLVELEVVRAPGLLPGCRFRFRHEAVDAMSVVDPVGRSFDLPLLRPS